MAIEQYNWDEAWRRVTGQPHPSSRTTNTDTDPIDWDKARYHAQIFDHNAAAGRRTNALRDYIAARKKYKQINESPRTWEKLYQTIEALHEGERKNVQRTPPKTQTSRQIQQATTPTKTTQTQEVAVPRDQRNPGGAESALAPENNKRAMAEQLRTLTQQNVIPAVDYASIPGQADYPTLSQYQSTEHGDGQVSAWTGAYRDTGFDDITYDIINRNPTAQLRGTTQNVFAGGALQSAERAYLTQLTDAEIGIFNYLYAQDTAAGDDTHYRAYRYIKDIKPQLTARARQESAETWQEQAQEAPVRTSLFSIGLSPLKGVGYVGQALDLMDDDKIDANAGYNLFANVSGDIRGTVSQMAEDKWGKAGSFAYNTAMSMADFLATTLVSGSFSSDAEMANLGKKLALGIMSSGSAADATTAAKERGLDDQEAFALGTIAGAAEMLTEKYSLDALLDPQWSSGAIKYVARNALVEGSEEVGSDLINTVADLLIAGDKNEINQAVQAYKKQGHSEEESFGLTMADMEAALLSGNRNEFYRALNRYLEQGYDYSVAYWMAMADQAAALGADYGEINRAIQGASATPTYNPGSTAQDDNEESVSDAEAIGLALRDKALSLGADFLGGALSGAATSGARVAVGRVMSDVELRQSGKTLRDRDANAAELLIRKAQEADVDSDVHKNAAALQQKLANGGKISDYEIGKLFSELSGYVQENGPLNGTQPATQDTTAQTETQPTLALPGGDEVQPTQTAPETAPVDSGSAETQLTPDTARTETPAPEPAQEELTLYPPAVQQAYNILQDMQGEETLTDVQQQMVDAAFATLNEYFAAAGDTTQPEAMAPAERTENNGQQTEQPDVLQLYGQQRVSAADDAGAVRPLEAGGESPAGRTFDGRGGAGRQSVVANDRLREAQNRGLMPGSTRELGWADGTNEPRVILYPEDAWDDELQTVATQWRGQGYQVQFVIGPLEFARDGFEQLADSVVQGNQIAIRANSIRWSAQQLSEHEGVHVWGGQQPQQRAAMLAELQDTLREAGEAGMRMWSRYAEAYGDAYNGDQDALLEEIAADVWAGINRVGRYADDAVVDQLLQVVERYVAGATPATMEQTTEVTSPAQGTELDRSNPTRAGPGETSVTPASGDSGATDSRGQPLSQEQAAYFDESEVRDEQYNLEAVYPTQSFRTELGQWFTAGKTGSNAYYLNITNPYYTTRADLEDALEGYESNAAYVDRRKSEGYDGLMISDGNDEVYVTFDPQQVKRTSDRNPGKTPDNRYSFAGQLSKTADHGALARAKEMDRQGVDAETIRRETGWFTGMDGEWRYEIDDSRMKLRYKPTSDVRTTLGELLDAPELFEAYPQLSGVNLAFNKLNDGENGYFDRGTNTIVLSDRLAGAPERTLIHEIQHTIQRIEGFASGSSPAYWNRQLENGFDGRTAEVKREGARLQEQYEQMRESDPQFVAAMEELDAMAPTVPRGKIDLDTLEQIEPDPPEWVRYDERRDQLEAQYGDRVWDWYSLRDDIDRNARNGGRTPTDLYRNTAGEIEARDVANRMDMTDEERMATPPDLGDENTVFAEDSSTYFAMSAEEQTGIREQLREHQSELNEMPPVGKASTSDYAGLDTRTAREKLVRELKKTGYQVDRPGFGVIQFDEREINNSLNYKEKDPSAEDARRTGFLVLKDVLKRGIEISGHENHKGRGYETLTIAAPVEINGQRGNMAVVVKQTKGNQYKVHRILTPDGGAFLLPEMANAEMNTVGAFTNDSQSLGGSAPAISSASDTSVASNAASVKPELSGETDSQGRELSQGQATYFENSEVRDRQYNLLPVYHATDNRFTIFDRDKLGSNTLGNATDWGMAATSLVGHWFSDHDVSGQMRSERSDEYYLNITNPYQTSLDALADELRSYAEDDVAVQDAFDMGDYAPARAAAQAYVEQLQSDGYDGLAVYDTEFGGTSYVAFDSQQAKLTNNRNPSDNPDVRYSLAGDTTDGLDLSQKKRRLVNRTMNSAAKELRGLINADTRSAREVQQNQLAALGRDILQKGSVPQSQVIDAFETIWAAGRQVDTTARDDALDIRDYLRKNGVSLAAEYRADVNGGDWNSFRRQNFGRLKITTDGLPVDVAYAELSGQRPDLFPEDITHPAEQIQRMADVADMLRPQERDMDSLYGSAAKGQIEAAFIDMVDQMQRALNPRERSFTPPAEWGDTEAEEADALYRLDVEADGQPVQDAMDGFQQPVQAAPAPVRLDSRAMGQEDLAQQVRQTAAKYGQEGRLTPRDPDEEYHLDWVELMDRETDENQAQLEQRRTRWKGEAQKMQAAGASREEILMRTGWYQTPEGEWRDFEQPRYNLSADQVQPDAMAEQIQNEYLRNLTRDEFRGSKSLENLGVKIAGSVGNYAQVDQLIANDRAARRVTRDVRKAEKRLRPSPTEVQLARSMADGLLTWDDLPRRKDVDKNTVAELADYYQMEKSLALDLLDERKREMFADVDHAVEQLMWGHDAVHISAAPIMHWRTPRRNLIRMFGRAQGQRMIDYLITPTAANEAERYRWTNKQYDMVREFEGEDGQKRALNKPERAATQLMLEGRAIEEQAAQLEERNHVYNAASQLQGGADAADVKQATGLNDELMEIADRLSQWRQAEADILANPEVDKKRVEAATKVLRERYASYYDAINDFLAAHGYKPIGFIHGYAPHLQPEEQKNALQKMLDSLGLGDQVTRLPANIAGLTQQFRPNKRWDPHFLRRMGDKTKLDAIEGFETYVDYLSDIFYHMDDTIRTRRMSNYFRSAYTSAEIHELISQAQAVYREPLAARVAFLQEVRALPEGSAQSAGAVAAALDNFIEQQYDALREGRTNMYSDFVNWLEDYANQLTAKQYVGDRGFETVFGRETLNLANKITNVFQRSQVAGNISTVLNQGAQSAIIVQACGPRNTMQALYDIANGKLQRDNFVDRSDFLTGKAGINRLIVDPTEKALHLLFTPAEAADTFVSTVATRAAYIQAVRDGLSDAEAMHAADLKAEQIMGSRMKGSRPQAFRSKNIFFRILNMFQLESLNTFEYFEQDTILQGFRDIRALKDKKGKYAAIAKLVSTLGQLLVSAFVVNRLAEEIYGGTPAAFDLIGYAASFLGAGRGLTTNEEIKRWLNATWRRVSGGDDLYEDVEPRKDSFDWGGAASELGEQIGSDLPMVRNIMGMMGLGDQSMPIPDVSTVKTAWETARESGLSWDTGRDISSAVAQLLPGGRQLSKSFNGLEVMLRGGKWRGDRLLYPVEDEIGNWLQALLFGPNGLVEQRGYYVGGAEGLSASETETYKALTEAGMSQAEAYNQMLDTHDLVPEEGYQSVRQIQKWEMLVDAGLSDSYLYAAVAASMSDDQRAKLDTALDSGVEMPVYVAWRRQMLADGGKTQEAMAAWLDAQSGLSNDAKAALWQLTNSGWKPAKNPYSVQIGEDIYAVYGPQN